MLLIAFQVLGLIESLQLYQEASSFSSLTAAGIVSIPSILPRMLLCMDVLHGPLSFTSTLHELSAHEWLIFCMRTVTLYVLVLQWRFVFWYYLISVLFYLCACFGTLLAFLWQQTSFWCCWCIFCWSSLQQPTMLFFFFAGIGCNDCKFVVSDEVLQRQREQSRQEGEV
jgi:hypothetical protein